MKLTQHQIAAARRMFQHEVDPIIEAEQKAQAKNLDVLTTHWKNVLKKAGLVTDDLTGAARSVAKRDERVYKQPDVYSKYHKLSQQFVDKLILSENGTDIEKALKDFIKDIK
jgi:hypothetical protein